MGSKIKRLCQQDAIKVEDDATVKSIALKVFGSNDGIRPRFPHTGGAIQEAMELSFAAGEKQGYEKGLKEQGSPMADIEIALADKEFAKRFRKEWIKDNRTIKPFLRGRQKGREEMIKEIEKHSLLECVGIDDSTQTVELEKCEWWQALLKKKGIKC